MAQYQLGTITITQGTNVVTGTNTQFLANVSVGDSFKVYGVLALYSVIAVTSDTELLISPNYAGTDVSGVAYQISRDFTPALGLAEISTGDSEFAFHLTHEVIRKLDSIVAGKADAGGPGSGQAFTVGDLTATSLNGFGISQTPAANQIPVVGADSSLTITSNDGGVRLVAARNTLQRLCMGSFTENVLTGYSDPAGAKLVTIRCTTDDANTPVVTGSVGIQFKIFNSIVAKFDASGNFGIGTTAPQDVLDLGVGTLGKGITWGSSNGTSRRASIFTSYSTSSLVFARGFHGSNTTDSYITSYTASYGASGIRMDYLGNTLFFNDPVAARTAGNAFTPTETMRVTPSGSVLIGTVTEDGLGTKLQVYGGASVVGNVNINGRLSGGFGASTAAGIKDWNDATNTVAGFGPTMLYGNDLNGPNSLSAYYHVMNIEYSTKTGAGNLTQFAIPYYYTAPNMYMRTRYNGVWSSWMQFMVQDSSGKINLPAGLTFPATQVASSDANTLDDYRESAFTATATGMTTSPTGNVGYVKVGNQVTLYLPQISGTSNATTFTLTGMPTVCRPSVARTVTVRTSNNGGTAGFAAANIGTDGVITLFSPGGAGAAFTASGVKSVEPLTVTYII